jgi:cell division septum initiation protein DivIVA
MGVTTQRIFRAKVDARLEVLEEDAEDLQRQAQERHDRLTELGVAPRQRLREVDWDGAIERLEQYAERAYRPVSKQAALVDAAVRNPRVAFTGRVVWNWIREGARYLAIACALLLPFVLAIALLAPPD